MTTNDSKHNSVMENVHDAIDGVDEPMEDSHSTGTGVMVAGAYPIFLVVLALGALAVLGFVSCVR
jgi:hypothetical protein